LRKHGQKRGSRRRAALPLALEKEERGKKKKRVATPTAPLRSYTAEEKDNEGGEDRGKFFSAEFPSKKNTARLDEEERRRHRRLG